MDMKLWEFPEKTWKWWEDFKSVVGVPLFERRRNSINYILEDLRV